METLQVTAATRLSPDLARKLDRLAETSRRSRSAVLRLLVESARPEDLVPWPYRQETVSDRR